MQFKDKAKWDSFAQVNNHGAALEIIDFAESWANLMEAELVKGRAVAEIADDTINHAKHYEYIAGSQYFYGVWLLYACWEHGEAIKDWHNAKHGIEAGRNGVLQDYLI